MDLSIIPQLLGDSDSKEPTHNAGDLGTIPGLGSSQGGGHGNPLQKSCLENPQGQRSLVGYSPLGGKESKMTEQLSTHTNINYAGGTAWKSECNFMYG